MTFDKAQLRFEQYDSIYISPHMDDAAFSCGGRMLLERAAGKRVLVVTVFGTGSEDDGRSGAFADYGKRKLEELEVMRALDADFVWLNQPELLYRRTSPSELVRYVFPFLRLRHGALSRLLHDELAALCTQRLAPGGMVYFPFAVGFHPDHRILFDVGRGLHAQGSLPIRFYDDVPYALTPALRAHRMRYLGVPSSTPLLHHTTQINGMLFWRFGGWSRVTWFVVWLYLTISHLLRALLGARDAFPEEPAPVADELDIGAVIDEKVRVMALYPSQVREFFPEGVRAVLFQNEQGRLIERTWRFPSFPTKALRLASLGSPLPSRLPSEEA